MQKAVALLLYFALLLAPVSELRATYFYAAGAAAGANIVADMWVTFEHAAVATSDFAANDNNASATWAKTDAASRITTNTSAERALVSTVNSTSDAAHARGLRIDLSGGEVSELVATFGSTAGANPVGCAVLFKCPDIADGSFNSVRLIALQGVLDYNVRVHITDKGSGNIITFRGGGSPVDLDTALTTGTWYWVEFTGKKSTASQTCKVRNSTTGVQVGSTITVTSGDGNIDFVAIGPDSTYTGEAGQVLDIDDVIVDYTTGAVTGP